VMLLQRTFYARTGMLIAMQFAVRK